MYRTVATTAVFLLLTVLTGSPAVAQQVSRTVPYRDLDLTTAPGVKALRHRVLKAVGFVCRGTSSPFQDLRCRQQAYRDVRPQVVRVIETAQRRADTQLAAR